MVTRAPRLALRILHPTLDPGVITRVLKIEPTLVQRSGDAVITPKGTRSGDTYKVSKWILTQEAANPFSGGEMGGIIDALEANAVSLADVLDGRGSIQIYISLRGDTHIGDMMSAENLSRLARLRLEIGFEVVPSGKSPATPR